MCKFFSINLKRLKNLNNPARRTKIMAIICFEGHNRLTSRCKVPCSTNHGSIKVAFCTLTHFRNAFNCLRSFELIKRRSMVLVHRLAKKLFGRPTAQDRKGKIKYKLCVLISSSVTVGKRPNYAINIAGLASIATYFC